MRQRRPLPRGPGSSKSRAAGLTLVELVLAASLFAGLFAAVGGLLLAGTRAYHAIGQADPAEALERALLLLDHDIQSAQALGVAPFALEARRLELVRVGILPDAAAADWLRVRYQVEEQDGILVLTREVFRWRDAAGAPLERRVLATLSDAVFEAAARTPEGALVWMPSWDGALSGIPRLVRLSLTVPRGVQTATLVRVLRQPAGALPEVAG